MKFLKIITCSMIFISSLSFAQQLSFPAGTAVVNVDVYAYSPKKNKPITTLKKADFNVFENGEKKVIRDVINENIPVDITVMVDVSISMKDKLPLVVSAVKKLIKLMQPGDLMQIVPFNELTTTTDFLSDPQVLIESLDTLIADKETFLYRSIYQVGKDLQRKIKDELKQNTHRRNALILLTDGIDSSSTSLGATKTEDEVLHLMSQAGVLTYAIQISSDSKFSRTANDRVRFFMTKLPEITGGRYFPLVDFGKLDEFYSTISFELHNQYLLIYESDINDKSLVRNISVTTNLENAPELRHRRQYKIK